MYNKLMQNPSIYFAVLYENLVDITYPILPKININYTQKTIVDVSPLNDNKRVQQGVFKIRFIKIICPLSYSRVQ